MTVADLTIFQLYCVIAASASIFASFCWAFRGVVTDTDNQLSWLGYAFVGLGAICGIVGPALYGAWILYSGLN
jgi:uncharacterized membrane protein